MSTKRGCNKPICTHSHILAARGTIGITYCEASGCSSALARDMPFTVGIVPSRRTRADRLVSGMLWSSCSHSRTTNAKESDPH